MTLLEVMLRWATYGLKREEEAKGFFRPSLQYLQQAFFWVSLNASLGFRRRPYLQIEADVLDVLFDLFEK